MDGEFTFLRCMEADTSLGMIWSVCMGGFSQLRPCPIVPVLHSRLAAWPGYHPSHFMSSRYGSVYFYTNLVCRRRNMRPHYRIAVIDPYEVLPKMQDFSCQLASKSSFKTASRWGVRKSQQAYFQCPYKSYYEIGWMESSHSCAAWKQIHPWG